MTRFASCGAFAAHLARVAATLPAVQRRAEEEAGHALAEASKREIGHEDAAWALLSEATMHGFEHPLAGHIAGKIELGFTGHVSATDPLLRTGALRESIGYQVTNHGLLLGTTSLIGLWQELGTSNARYPIPPRPFIGNTMFRHGREAAQHIAGSIMAAIAARRPPAAPVF